jgi:sortase A
VLAVALLAPQVVSMAVRAQLAGSGPDASWSESRRQAFQRLSAGTVPAPVAYLTLDEQDVRVPVFSGIEEAKLTLGAGHLPETGPVGGGGNAAIAGHRDGYFRSLRHVETGDLIGLDTPAGRQRYRVTETWLVAPEDVWVLDATDRPSLTLITCHPFYFVGHAPDRYVVRAERVEEDPANPPVVQAAEGGQT